MRNDVDSVEPGKHQQCEQHAKSKSQSHPGGKKSPCRLPCSIVHRHYLLSDHHVPARRDDAFANCIKYEVGQTVEVELLKNVLTMANHRGGTKVENIGNIFVGLAF